MFHVVHVKISSMLKETFKILNEKGEIRTIEKGAQIFKQYIRRIYSIFHR